MRKWMVNSDAVRDPQAYVLTPVNAVRIADAIVRAGNHYLAGKAAALTAVKLLREGVEAGEVKIPANEVRWLDLIEAGVEALPDDEDAFIDQQLAVIEPGRFLPGEYGLLADPVL
jgi:methanol--5-hydroxybenzimidazolylcobamide Co-methyltransferase